LGDVAEIVGGGTPNTSIIEYWCDEIDWYAPAEIEGSNFSHWQPEKKLRLV
jgi:type I restriction enzyme S subunit